MYQPSTPARTFTAMMAFENDQESAKFEIIKPFSFLFGPPFERIFIKRHSIESRCYRTGKYTVCRRVRASFSPDILQAGAVKGSRIPSTGSHAVVRTHKNTAHTGRNG